MDGIIKHWLPNLLSACLLLVQFRDYGVQERALGLSMAVLGVAEFVWRDSPRETSQRFAVAMFTLLAFQVLQPAGEIVNPGGLHGIQDARADDEKVNHWPVVRPVSSPHNAASPN